MAKTQHDSDIINAERQRQEDSMRAHLEHYGVQVSIQRFTGDNSYPVEYTLTHGTISALGPTWDLALMDFIEKLLKVRQA